MAATLAFDSHCHLDFQAFDADRDSVLARAFQAGVGDVFVPGYRPSQGERAGELVRERAKPVRLHFGAGLHPYALEQLDEAEVQAELQRIPALVEELGAVAVGECGLDARLAKRGTASRERQERVLRRQLALGRELELPVVLHAVGAHGELLRVLRSEPRLARGGVLHSYSGSAELVPRFAELGLCFGYSAGQLLRPGARRVFEALAATPPDRLLFETDAPDQPPPGHERSEPALVVEAVRAAVRALDDEPEALAALTRDNARRLYQLGE